MKRLAAAFAAAALISCAAFAASCARKPDAERNVETADDGLRRRVYALESERKVLAKDLLYMTAKNEAAIEMAENLLVYTRLSYPMRREEIIEALAGYQSGLLALLDKLREIK